MPWILLVGLSGSSTILSPASVREGKDVGGLIQSFHDMAPMAGLVAALPWLMNPILKNPIFKHFMMPRAGDRTGTGKIMKVSSSGIETEMEI